MNGVLKRTAVEWVPKPYMKEAVKFLLSHGAAGLWLDPGLGKTSCTLTAFAQLLKAGTARKMLVIAPMRVCRSVWPREVEKWKHLEHLRVEVLHGPKKEAAIRRDADVYCINPEGLTWLLTKGRFALQDWDVLCIDEVTKFKHTNTARFKMVKPFLGRFRRRWTLTGTPAPNGLMDIFGQVYCLDLGHALGPYITAFRNEYFDPSGFGGYAWVLKEGGEERIYEKVRPLVLRISDEVLDLPKLVFNDVKVELPSDAMRAYKDMETVLVTLLNDGTRVSAVSAGVAAGKCLQICNGGLYHQDEDFKRVAKVIHNAKVEAVEDLLEEISQKPALLLYSFDHDRQRLKEAFPNAPCVADMSAKKADELFDKWNRGEVPLMMAQPQSIGHGLNLQGGGQHIIWFGVPWDLEIWLQAIRRLLRQGSEFSHIFCHAILAEGTIDEVVRAVINGKDKTQNALLNAVKNKYSGTLTGAAIADIRKHATVPQAKAATIGRKKPK